MGKYEFKIIKEDNYETIANYLKSKQNFSSALIRQVRDFEGGILKNGLPIRTIDSIKEGDLLCITLPLEKSDLLLTDKRVPIVFEDNELIIFNKPAGMPTHPSALHPNDTLGNVYVSLLKERGESGVFRPINRLDKNTSGLVVAAKNKYSALWLQQSLKKVYYAIIKGHLQEKRGTISLPIGRKGDSIIEREVTKDGQEAITHYEVVEEYKGYSLLKINLQTGRTHQIRVHFSHLGYPLLGDNLYGGDTTLLKRQALVCGDVTFMHFIQNKVYKFSIDLGQDIQKALVYIQK